MPLWRPLRFCEKKRGNNAKRTRRIPPHARRPGVLDRHQRHPRGDDRARARAPLLFLHPGIGIEPTAPVLDRLAARARVIAPTHPGFGALGAAEGVRYGRRPRLFLPRPAGAARPARDDRRSACRSAAGSPPRSRSSRPRACRGWCSPMRSASRSATARPATSSTSSPCPRASSTQLAYSDPASARATTRRCRTPTCWPPRATARRPRATPGRPTCTIPKLKRPAAPHPHSDPGAVGHGRPHPVASPTAAPIAPRFRARASS